MQCIFNSLFHHRLAKMQLAIWPQLNVCFHKRNRAAVSEKYINDMGNHFNDKPLTNRLY